MSEANLCSLSLHAACLFIAFSACCSKQCSPQCGFAWCSSLYPDSAGYGLLNCTRPAYVSATLSRWSQRFVASVLWLVWFCDIADNVSTKSALLVGHILLRLSRHCDDRQLRVSRYCCCRKNEGHFVNFVRSRVSFHSKPLEGNATCW